MPSNETTDKAPWGPAARVLFKETAAAAQDAKGELKDMVLSELEMTWAAVPVFKVDGSPEADTKEPGTTPFKVRALYSRYVEPKIG